MFTFLRPVRNLLVSLKLTVVLIVFSIVLVLASTLDQMNIDSWAVQQKYFYTWIVFWPVGSFSLAIFPGGYVIGGLLLANLLAAHIYRLKLTWRKLGIWFAHAGLILLIVGQLLTGLLQDEYHMRIDQGQTKSYSESDRKIELAITDTTDPKFDDVVAIPESAVARLETVQHPKLPFRVVVKTFFPNALLQTITPAAGTAPAGETMQGVAQQEFATLQPVTYKPNESNTPCAYVELDGEKGVLGTWLVSPNYNPQAFTLDGKEYKIELRFARHYQPYSLTLLKFSHDIYAGTDIPKNFSSRVRVTTPDGRDDQEVLIYMNHPLRYGGLTFYQAGFQNNDRTTILSVVRTPSWLIPYISCAIITFGLLFQFVLHLVGFIGRPRAAAPAAGAATGAAGASGRVGWVPIVVLTLAVAGVVCTLVLPGPHSDYDLEGFGRLPTLVNGRIKPLDTVARTSLLELQGRQRVTAADGHAVSPSEWLLDMLFRPEVANSYPVFEIVHPDVLTLFNLSPEDGAGKKRFTFTQIEHGLAELDRQSKLADAVESALRTPFQRGVVKLRDGVVLYESIQDSLLAPGVDDFLGQLSHFDQTAAAGLAAVAAQQAGQPHDVAASKALLDLSQSFAALEQVGYLRPIPPETGKTDAAGWRNAGAALNASMGTGRLDPAMAAYVGIGQAWRGYQPADFNKRVGDYRSGLEKEIPAFLQKCDAEARFNAAEPFYTGMILYVVAFLLAIVSWLKWPEALGRAAFWIVALAWVVSTVGIVTRMWLEGRPPVTNLYSSALFIGWVVGLLCLVIEWIFKNAVGSVAAGVVGFSTLLIAHHLAFGGDTLEMMRAVLDSNFWLGTHVVTVTIGYAATFLAGFLALIYVLRGLFTRSLDKATADSLGKMVYGIVCFAMLFSFVGTVLGGIWADLSWGRLWGWDPMENGALIIVLWNALILHARWGGLVKQRGLMNLAIFGNIVTSWSWFGVNMLGVGLHSYGFMDAAFWWLLGFVISQLVLILVACVPLDKWASFRPRAAA